MFEQNGNLIDVNRVCLISSSRPSRLDHPAQHVVAHQLLFISLISM